MDKLQQEKQSKIEIIIEEVTAQKFERLSELKSSFDFMIKRLEATKPKPEVLQAHKEKIDAKKREKEDAIKALIGEMELIKKQKIHDLNEEYENKKRELLKEQKEQTILE